MKDRVWTKLLLGISICVCFHGSCATVAWASRGVFSHAFFWAEHAQEPHPKSLETALAITRKMVDSEGAPQPIYFGFRYAIGTSEGKKTKVMVQVKVYRGAKRLWQAKHKMRPEEDPRFEHVLCKTFNKGLLPGDVVRFSYKFKKAPRPGKVDLIRLFSVAGPAEMWEQDPLGLWPLAESYRECVH